MKNFAKLLQIGKTVFRIDDIYQIFDLKNKFSLRNLLSRFGKSWLLKNIYYWIRVLPNYDKYELANCLQRPSYISLETVLYHQWIIFQDYSHVIFSIWIKTQNISIGNINYDYKTIKKEIFFDQTWIIYKDWYAIATLERALCDRLYLTPWYYFDNLRGIDWSVVETIAKIYQNKRLILDIKKLKDGIKY